MRSGSSAAKATLVVGGAAFATGAKRLDLLDDLLVFLACSMQELATAGWIQAEDVARPVTSATEGARHEVHPSSYE